MAQGVGTGSQKPSVPLAPSSVHVWPVAQGASSSSMRHARSHVHALARQTQMPPEAQSALAIVSTHA
jgi:hypothetical protein